MAKESVIQIGRPAAQDFPSKLLAGFVADKFFIAAILSSLIGIGWIGSHLWLRLHGQLPMDQHFISLRQLHILVQFYLFFGVAILGFIAQAAPKICGAQKPASGRTIFWIPLLLLAVLLAKQDINASLWKIVCCGVFLSALFYLASHFKQSPQPPLTIAPWIFTGLLGLSTSPFLNLQLPLSALLIFWFSVFPIIIGVSQQFIAGFLGGNKLSLPQSYTIFFVYLLASAAAIAQYQAPESEIFSRLWGATALTLLLLHAFLSGYWKCKSLFCVKPLPTAFILAFFWAIFGALHFAIFGSAYADSTLHIWSIGWGSTLVIAVSIQILSFMSQQANSWHKTSLALILIWQLVAIGRSASPLLPLPREFSLVVLMAATLTLLGWIGVLAIFERRILQLSRVFNKNHRTSQQH